VGPVGADPVRHGSGPEGEALRRPAGAAVVAALAIAAPSSATPDWSAPARLSTSSRALGPELALSPSGHAIVVWDREEGADCATSPASLGCVHIVTSRSRAAAAWAAETEVNRPGVGSSPRAATNDAGNEALIWIHDIGADRVVQATLRRSSGDPFPNANDLSKEVNEVRNERIALDAAGNAIAVWAERRGGDFTVEAEFRRAGIWGAALALSPPSSEPGFFGPALAANSRGDAVAAWVESGAVAATILSVPAATREPRTILSAAGGVAEGDASAAINAAGDAVVVWPLRNVQMGERLVQAAFRPAGGQWGGPVDLGRTQEGAVPPRPQVAIDGAGNAVAVWVGGSGRTSLETARFARAGMAWSRPVTAVASGASEPGLAMDPAGSAVVVWRNEGTRRIEASIRPAAATAWQPQLFLSPPDPDLSKVDASAPRVSIDDSGRALVVWQRGTGDVAVESAELSGSWAPTLANTRRPAVRGRARVGATLLCERGDWDGTRPIAYAFRWLRNGRPNAGATAATYRVRRRDAGSLLACRVTGSNVARRIAATSRPVRVPRA
jgi:hypothetical protein